EMSVGINAIMLKTPEVFAGNLIGASFVLVLFVIPLLVVMHKGVQFQSNFNAEKIFFFLLLILASALVVLDGVVSVYDAILLILMYGFFFYFFQHYKKITHELEKKSINTKALLLCAVKIMRGAVLIYFASLLLVEKTLYFATLLNAPPFVVSMLLLSLGTNLPEITIAINSLAHRQPEIALGDYIGSAAFNIMLLGIFSLFNGTFTLDTNHFGLIFPIVIFGFVMFFIFSKSKNKLSFWEGVALLMVFFLYVLAESTDILF
ncbi:hypothetical protein IT411_02525, partial [Candidatus Peregrinibacteria bacterium]|nr:hypothetical protein [Candidatus Peregrinibacteria bacterium]